ncbi:MAG: GNAT family N-acetyltransferase [Bacteriovoracaceae bacterium]|jgi:ribosomal protein S18 acetylase RimI-like enzyme|nr:GNAT family N-acetyltransferase [Bacteriovoracaceae bacterium]
MIDRYNKSYYEQVCEIFFETSSVKTFSSLEQKDAFRKKYLDDYLNRFEEFCFVALKDNQVIGYVICCPMTILDKNLLSVFSYYEDKEEFVAQYPAHLHINLSAHARGMGLGAKLMYFLFSKLKKNGVNALHVFTNSKHPSFNFYLKYKFGVLFEDPQTHLVMMGIKF